jgi:hypothetical protein
MLPSYRFDALSGLWEHTGGRGEAPLSLAEIDYASGAMHYEHQPQRDPDHILADYLSEAERLLDDALPSSVPPEPVDTTEGFERLRWFTYPHEVAADA